MNKPIEIAIAIDPAMTPEQIADVAIAISQVKETPSLADVWVDASSTQAVVTLSFEPKSKP